jgi:predicted negative regulator of RcsB-dependent stress response
MATHLDLEEQEQLDAVKRFWKQYGNLITWLLVLVLGGFAAWNGWQWWQRDQAIKAGAMFDELDRAAQAGEIDKVTRIFNDLKERFGSTTFAQQGALLTAKAQAEKDQSDAAIATLQWVATQAGEAEFQTLARLRLAGLLLDAKKPDEALKQLDAATEPDFAALVADRRGDVLLAMGKGEEAQASYLKAWQAMDAKIEYRRLIEAKLTALGAAPAASAASAASSASAASTGATQ